MKVTGEKRAHNVQQAKNVVSNRTKEFTEYISRCLDDDDFVDAMNDLLPFDKCLLSKMNIEDDASIVKSMGLSIMRMEPESPLFSLGISIEIAGDAENKAVTSTIFMFACRTLEDLRKAVKCENFEMKVWENLGMLIDE